MLSLLPERVEAYLAERAAPSDPVLKRMEAQAAREQFPIVGPQVGRLLRVLTLAVAARRVFELGSGFGYSALWFARALPRGGQVVLTDRDPARSRQARAFFRAARQSSKATFLVGDAVSLLRAQRGMFDIIFLDADKARYPLALKAAVPKLRRGGLLIADNVLWSGRVAEPHPDAEIRGLLAFTRGILAARHLSSSILPVRDGVSISVKTA